MKLLLMIIPQDICNELRYTAAWNLWQLLVSHWPTQQFSYYATLYSARS